MSHLSRSARLQYFGDAPGLEQWRTSPSYKNPLTILQEDDGGKNLLREADSGPLGMFWEFSRNVPSLGAFTHAYRRGSLGDGTPILN